MSVINKRFGRLTVVRRSPNRNGYVVCKCDCGNTVEVRQSSLTKSNKPTRSCGCYHREVVSAVGSKTISGNSEESIATNMRYCTNFHIIEKTEPIKSNKSGHTGVWFNPRRGMYEAYISVHRKRISLGRFRSMDDAVKVREAAEDKFFAPLIEAKKSEAVVNT